MVKHGAENHSEPPGGCPDAAAIDGKPRHFHPFSLLVRKVGIFCVIFAQKDNKWAIVTCPTSLKVTGVTVYDIISQSDL